MDVCKFCKGQCKTEKGSSNYQSEYEMFDGKMRKTGYCKCYPIIPPWKIHECDYCIECNRWQ